MFAALWILVLFVVFEGVKIDSDLSAFVLGGCMIGLGGFIFTRLDREFRSASYYAINELLHRGLIAGPTSHYWQLPFINPAQIDIFYDVPSSGSHCLHWQTFFGEILDEEDFLTFVQASDPWNQNLGYPDVEGPRFVFLLQSAHDNPLSALAEQSQIKAIDHGKFIETWADFLGGTDAG